MSSEKDIDLSTYVDKTEPADVLYNQGLANMNAGRLQEASRKFEAVDKQHPYSEYARKSMVMGAFANYRQGNYEEAIGSAKRYLTLYPTTDDAAYAQYIVGLSYYRQIRDVTQDQKEARQTLQTMQELVTRWPDSEYVEDAKAKISKITGMVEKPPRGTAPSNLHVSGRYILQPTIFNLLANQEKGAGGEIQLTDSMIALSRQEPFYAVRFDGDIYDAGSKIGFLAANVAYALDRSDLGPQLRAEIEKLLDR